MTVTDTPPQARLVELSTGYIVTKALAVAAQLSIADRLAAGPRASDDLAAEANVHPRALYRVLRCLGAHGVLSETEPGRFELTPVGECLRDDAPGSMRAWAIMNSEVTFGAFADALHSVRTEEPAFERVFGVPLFEFLGDRPEQREVFARAMGDFNRAATLAAARTYDWSGVTRVVDVGGGSGTLIADVLERHRDIGGVLFDLPEVVAEIPGNGRLEVVGGDFFEAVPAGGDAYVLSWILHDWDDERALAILRNCREAIVPNGRLLIVETILPPGDEPHFGKVLDVAMLVITGGRERTEAEYAGLLERAGFRLNRVLPTPTPMGVVEAIAC
jgi:O-methyltransferase domain